MKIENTAVLISLILLTACGGGSPSSPSDPGPGPAPVPGHPVSGVVFYDVNANGTLDAGETVRLPAVRVTIGGRTGDAGADGRFTVSDVPAGEQPAEVQAESLPAYFEPGQAMTVSVPQGGGEIEVPATLEIGSNRPNHYLAFGDSITSGVGGGVGGGSPGTSRRISVRIGARESWATPGIPARGATRARRGSGRACSASAGLSR